MLIELSNIAIIVLNVVGIPLAHLGFAYLSLKLPPSLFEAKGECGETSLWVYRKLWLVPKWKRILPDGSRIVGGFSKAQLKSLDEAYLKTFIMETRRGQFSHWLQMIVISGFIVWNPWPANLIIVIYAVLSNLPCILNLRYTELRLKNMLVKRGA